jgi:hypothetical protein
LMALACGYPMENEWKPIGVPIVGDSGVGNAVNAFN